MNEPIKDYKYLQSVQNIENIAEDELLTKYLIDNKRNLEKFTDLESTDTEGLLIEKNGGTPLPGFIYTFIYKSGFKEKLQDKNTLFSFVDFAPLVFCFSVNLKGFSGINFNLLPPKDRLYFLQTYYKLYPKFFNNLDDVLYREDKPGLNIEFTNAVAGGNGPKLLELFSKKSNTNLKFAYRQYYFHSIKNLRMIEFNEWKYIPFYNPKHSIKGINFKIIYYLYKKTLGNLLN